VEVARSGSSNRLADEASPYLRQHADNPVDWYPWGEPALSRARAEGKPLFVSIGYAACHWCHVMERESFEDPAVADLLARHFVAVKVDREERPDIDAVYMEAVQVMTGRGGWPLSVFLTPELEPFYGGTYFPPERRFGMPSFREVLEAVAQAWERRRDDIRSQAAALAAHLAAGVRQPVSDELDIAGATNLAITRLEHAHDTRWGGFGGAPKFPSPSRLYLLLEHARAGSASSRRMLATTLDGMAAGGMWDWVGGGFHRYSVDERWLVPHFEKMLYDNALLARAYGAAGVLLSRPDWVEIARRTATYLIGEMQGEEGGFTSSTDADSEGGEGRFFTWTPAEVRAALPPKAAEALIRLCGLDGDANFEEGRFVLRPSLSSAALAAALGTSVEAVAELVRGARSQLLQARRRRIPPLTDDKRLAGWNGMAVWSLAHLGALLESRELTAAAQACARFLLAAMVRSDGTVVRSWRAGRTSGVETLEDVAWVAAGLTELYQSDGDVAWLRGALALVGARLPRYQDSSGAVFETPDDGERLPTRPRSPYDGALPSSLAVLCDTLVRLATLSGRQELAAAARRAVTAETAVLSRAPEAACSLLAAAALVERPPLEVVVVGDPSSGAVAAMLRAARHSARRPSVLAVSPAVPVPDATAELVTLFAGRQQGEAGRALAYLCETGSCRLPTDDPSELGQALGRMG
jgi:uncharacterized protein YyaL (SSP411 family)